MRVHILMAREWSANNQIEGQLFMLMAMMEFGHMRMIMHQSHMAM